MNTKSIEILETIQTRNLLTSLAVDSLARTSALLEKVSELQANEAAYGLKCSVLWGKLDQTTLSLKTAQCSLFEDLSKSYATFPKSGIMQNGNVYQAPTLESNRVGSDFIVLPTPCKSDMKGACKNRYFGSSTYRSNLREFIRDGEQDGIYPNPELYERLMTFPISWTE